MAKRTVMVLLAALVGVGASLAAATTQEPEGPAQDPVVLRFVERALPWYPDSLYRLTADERRMTPSGAYREVTVERDSPSDFFSGSSTLIIDEGNDTIWLGVTGQLPLKEAGVGANGLKGFLEGFLPEALGKSLGLKLRVDWDTGGAPSGALLPFTLRIDTGYGEFPKPAAVTTDGARIVLGIWYPIDDDPVEIRRQLLASSDLVMWDHSGVDGNVEVVEFSDLECPACRRKWPLLNAQLSRHGDGTRHGMVSFPLTTIHPWAFRGASATWCVAAQQPSVLSSFKELFYGLQRDMSVSLVTPTSIDFVTMNALDEARFRACYLKQESLDAVHGQIALAHRLGVSSTPTYFVDGWMVQAPEPSWFEGFVDRLVSGEEP